MSRPPFRTLILFGGWLATAGTASAQYPYPPAGGYQPGGVYGTPARPPVSPYLNILQGNRNPGVNYYNFTRPAVQAQQFYQQQQSYGLPAIEPFGLASRDVTFDLGRDPSTQMPAPTGHPAAFMYFNNSYGPYFNSLGTIGGAPARGGQAGGVPRPQVPTAARR